MNSRKFIQLGIPLLLVLLFAAAAVFEHFAIIRQREHRRNGEVMDLAERQAAWLAGVAAKSEKESAAALQADLAYLAEDTDLKYAIVCDSQRRILAATREEWISRPLPSTAAEDAEDIVRLAQKSGEPQVRIILPQDIAIAAHPFNNINGRQKNSNVVVIERDLSKAQDLARKGALQDSMISGGILFFVGAVLWTSFRWLLRVQERKTDDAKLRQETLAETLGAAVLTTRDDRIQSISHTGLQLLGARSPDQVLGRSPFDFIHGESQQKARDLIRAVQQAGASPPPIESKIVRADGAPVDVKITAIADSTGESGAVQLILNDLTEQREREASRAALSRDLEEKNRELEAIVYVASHDLRSPLLNVMGFSRQLDSACRQIAPLVRGNGAEHEKLGVILENTVPRALKFIEQGVTRMDSLLTGFLRYSRIGRQEIEPQKLDMNAMLRSISSNLAYQMQQADTELRIEDLPPCMGDPMQINQVFSNLLDNAIKFRKPGVPCVIHITGKIEDAQAAYSVTDNGTGIAPEHQRIIFEIFHRLNPSATEGEGLGLTIAQRIVQRHNGAISLVSQPGVGSTFTVRLPAAS